jgi:hypothetical protein
LKQNDDINTVKFIVCELDFNRRGNIIHRFM